MFGCYPKKMNGKEEEIHNILVALLNGKEEEIYNILYKKKEIDDTIDQTWSGPVMT